MANRLFGEATLRLNEGRELTLRLDFEAMCAIEEAANLGWDKIMARLEDPDAPKLRVRTAMVAGMLSHHHPDESSVNSAGNLLQSDGTAVMKAMTAALEQAFGGRAARPRPGTAPKGKAPSRGTGMHSSKSGSKPG